MTHDARITHRGGRLPLPAWTFAVAVAAAALAGACAEATAPAVDSSETASPTRPAADAPSGPAAESVATVADLFPPGPGRDQVLNNCGSCHNLACATIGQRPAARWDALRDSHRDKVSDGLDAMFAYLKANFDESKPEPQVPSRFLEGGCTPF